MVSCLNNRLSKIVWGSCERRSAFIEFLFSGWRSTGTEAVSRSRRFNNPMSSHDTTRPYIAVGCRPERVLRVVTLSLRDRNRPGNP